MTSTKKQKMLISRSVVNTVNTEWDPPGRFLEKQSSGLWSEVPIKKALEKTAQALRDGAFPLRKQLSEDFSDPSFLEAVFDTKVESVSTAAAAAKPSHPLKSKGHRRMVSAPVVTAPVNFDSLLDLDPDPKRSRPNSPSYLPHEPFVDMELPLQNLTGMNFPSPAVQENQLEFHIGSTNDQDQARNRSHRRSKTYGGYSCSDANISQLHVDDIFAMFMGPQKNQHQSIGGVEVMANSSQQAAVAQKAMQPEGSQQNFMSGMTMSHTNHMMQVPAPAPVDFSQQQFQNAPMPQQQLLHNNHVAATPSPVQLDQNVLTGAFHAPSPQTMTLNEQAALQNHQMGSLPQASTTWTINQQINQSAQTQVPSAAQLMNNMGIVFDQGDSGRGDAALGTSQTINIGQQQQSIINPIDMSSIPDLAVNLGLQQQNHSDPNLMSTIPGMGTDQATASNVGKSLSGAKRHRRHNTIANGYCYPSHRTNEASHTETKAQNFDLDFLNNIHLSEEPLHDDLNKQPLGGASAQDLQFHDFSSFELPLAAPSLSPAKGRHRRLNTTGHIAAPIGLPEEFDFTMEKSSFLNTIHEEIPNVPLTADCGSMMSSAAGGSSSFNGTHESKPSQETTPSASSFNALLNTVIPTIDTAHRRNESTKSSLSTEDFCFHLAAGGDGFDENEDGLVINSGI